MSGDCHQKTGLIRSAIVAVMKSTMTLTTLTENFFVRIVDMTFVENGLSMAHLSNVKGVAKQLILMILTTTFAVRLTVRIVLGSIFKSNEIDKTLQNRT